MENINFINDSEAVPNNNELGDSKEKNLQR
jgi:hypothetical protein